MQAQCSRLMYFIRGSVLHVWLNLTGAGKPWDNSSDISRMPGGGIGGLCLCETAEGEEKKGRSLLCLLMTVRSLRRQDADGPREHTAGVEAVVVVGRKGGREEEGMHCKVTLCPGGGSHPPFTAAAVIHTELPCGALVWAKRTFVPDNAYGRRRG